MRLLAYADLRYTRGPATGVYHHIARVLSSLSSQKDIELRLAVARGQLGPGDTIPADNALHSLRPVPLPISNKEARALWGLCDRPALDDFAPAASFAPHWVYSPQELLAPCARARSACTLHGMTYFEPSVGKAVYASRAWRSGRLRLGHFLRRARATSDIVFCVSDYLRRQAVERFDFDPRRVVVVGNGVNESFFAAASAPAPGTPPEAEGRPWILSVGGLNAFDGGSATLEAARILARRLPDHRFLVAGRLHEPDLAARAASIPNLRLLGFVPSDRLADLMRGADALLCLPAVESFGIVPLEAMAVGCPVVAGDSTALPETVGQGGCVVPFGDPHAAAEAVAALVEDREKRAAAIAQGAERARHFTWDRVAARVVAALATAAPIE